MSITRRELLKRGTIAGVVWATPAVQSMSMMRSAAAAVSPDECPVELTFNRLNCIDAEDTKQALFNVANLGGPGAATIQFTARQEGCGSNQPLGVSNPVVPPGDTSGFFAAGVPLAADCQVEVFVDIYLEGGTDVICTLRTTYQHTPDACP